jgi:hypothetical protein
MPEPGISRTARHAKVASSPARTQHRLDETVLGAAVLRGTLLASFDGQGLASPLSIARACACERFALVEVAPRGIQAPTLPFLSQGRDAPALAPSARVCARRATGCIASPPDGLR